MFMKRDNNYMRVLKGYCLFCAGKKEFDALGLNKGEFRCRPISAFVYVLALSQSKCVICEIYKQTHALKFEKSCKRIFIFISPK